MDTENNDEALKKQKEDFARKLLKTPNDPKGVALSLFPDNPGRAMWIGANWPLDSEVISFTEALRNDDEESMSLLPSKADLCTVIYSRITNDRTTNEDFAKLAKLYAEVRGFIEKPQQINNNVVNQNKVMFVRDFGTDEQWEAAAEAQQKALIDANSTRH